MGGIAERSVGARGLGYVMLECTDRLTVVQTLIQYPEWVGNRSDRKGCSFPSTTFDLGRRVLAWRSTTAGGRWECDRGGRALPAEVEFTAIQCGVYSCVHFRLLVCVRDRQLVSAVAGLCVFPGVCGGHTAYRRALARPVHPAYRTSKIWRAEAL